MPRVKGVYDGSIVRPVEPLAVPADTVVEILVPEPDEATEQHFWQRLLELGLIKDVRYGAVQDEPFEPIPYRGKPVSESIIEERR